jgi:hypothetical protein
MNGDMRRRMSSTKMSTLFMQCILMNEWWTYEIGDIMCAIIRGE